MMRVVSSSNTPMIDLGTLTIRDVKSFVEARRKLSLVTAALALDSIDAACVVTGLSEIGRRLLATQPHFDVNLGIHTNPPRVTLHLAFTATSLSPEEIGVTELFESVKRMDDQGRRIIVCAKALPIYTQQLTAPFIEQQRRMIRQKSRDELMHDMRAMNEDLTAKNLQLEDFAFSTAHTLKTDWLGVGYLVEELLEVLEADGVVEGTEAHELMTEIKTRVGRGARTVDELLAYSTLGNGIERTPQSLRAVVIETVTKVGNALLVVDPEFKDLTLPLDVMKFGKALREVLNNAIVFGLGRPVAIECDGRALRIRDQGRGIPKDSLVEIFGLFRRAATDGTGSGIGLAIAKQVIAAHGYRIWAESAGVGQGSTFVISFSEDSDGAASLMPSKAPLGK